MNRPIPVRPSLEKDRKAAKTLRKAHAEGAAEALARIRESHPRFRGREVAEVAAMRFRLADAQLVVAREYGVSSWPRWKALVEFLAADLEQRASLFLGAALGDDARRAHELLAHSPELARANLHTACATAEESAVDAFLERDPEAAARRDGPGGATPLWTLCWSVLTRAPDRGARAQIALKLLRLGADPNAKAVQDSIYGPWSTTPVMGAVRRRSLGLLKAILEAGGEPDEDVMYHATEPGSQAAIPLLLQYGGDPNSRNTLTHALDFEDREVVQQLLEAGADPNVVSSYRGHTALQHAAWRGRDAAIVDLILDRGGEIEARDATGRTPYQVARRCGNTAAAERLLARGASEALSVVDRFVAACAAGLGSEARAVLAEDPELLERLDDDDLSLLPECVQLGRAEAVRTMLDVGFPIEHKGTDIGASALNFAAKDGNLPLLELLLDRGADPESENAHGGTALDALCWGSRNHDPLEPEAEAELQARLVACAERLIAAGAKTAPQQVANASPPVADVLRRRGTAEPEEA